MAQGSGSRASSRARTPSQAGSAAGTEVLVASARAYDLASKQDLAALAKKKDARWQERAWHYFDNTPEVGFGVSYIGHMLSRLRLFPAWVPDANSDPVPLDADDPEQAAEIGQPGIAEAAQVVLDSLSGPSGNHGALIGPLAQQLSVPGEGFVCAVPGDEGEEWDAYSLAELKISDQEVRLLQGPEDREGEALPPETFFLRVWQRHPKYRNQAISPMKQLGETCDELLLLSQAIRAGARQRLNAGILLIPNELTVIQPPATSNGQDPQQHPLLMSMVQAMSLPIQDPDAATALVPLLLKGPKEALDAVRHLTLERPFDEVQLHQRDELRGVLATGMDLPREIILGLADANHWTGWLVDEQTYKAHLDPLALLMLDALTRKVLQQRLKEEGFDPASIIIWRDPDDLIADQDAWTKALAAHEALVISDAALRARGGFSEEEKPDDDEIEARVERIAAQKGRAQEPPTAPNLSGDQPGQGATSNPGGQTPPADQGPPEQPPAEAAPAPAQAASAGPRAIVAALRPRGSLDRLAGRLHAIDRETRARIQEAADAAVQRTLEIAGTRVRRRVQGSLDKIPDPAARARRLDTQAQIRGWRHEDIAWRLGRKAIAQLGLDEEDLIDDEFGSLDEAEAEQGDGGRRKTLAAIFLASTTAGYAAARAAANRNVAGRMDPADEERQQLAEKVAIGAGWALLSASLAAFVRQAIFEPPGQPPAARGEFDSSKTVPPGIVRDALAVAGGAPSSGPDPMTGQPSGGIGTGELTSQMLSQFFGVTAEGGQWVYGDPGARGRPFEPHEALDGVSFASYDDDVLANSDTFPPVAFFFPGDHDGCQCDIIPALALASDQTGAEEEVA